METNLQPHIRLSKDLQVNYALLPGDPLRVDRVKPFLTDVKDLEFNREYKSAVGFYKGFKVLVVSTGIGGPSTGIAIEELANIGVKSMIRIGSCGALQKYMQLGDLVVASGSVRDEGTSKAYIHKSYPAVADHQLLTSIENACKEKHLRYHVGLVRSHDSFYTDKEEAIDEFWSEKGILGADMETSSLFVIGRLRGLKTASILNVVVPSQGNLETGINDFVSGEEQTYEGEEKQIKVSLEAFASIHHNKS